MNLEYRGFCHFFFFVLGKFLQGFLMRNCNSFPQILLDGRRKDGLPVVGIVAVIGWDLSC